ncbi:MAG: uroporphyrinogen-III synthase [Bacteroidia bacterium]|jgi:uroporphyrinogen-III synthase
MTAERAVLVTRPAGVANDHLCEILAAAGYEASSQPLLELRALAPLPAPARSLVQSLDNYEHVIFISTNAVGFGMLAIENYWPQLPVGLSWYAIGEATATLLQEHGISAITPGSLMTSEGLLAVPQLQAIAGQRVLIVKGEGGREALARTLRDRDATVDELACYQRYCPTLAPGDLARRLQNDNIGAVLLSSGEGLANMRQLLSPAETTKFTSLYLVVPSDRVAKLALEAGFKQIVIAENASDAAMLRALGDWQRSSGE